MLKKFILCRPIKACWFLGRFIVLVWVLILFCYGKMTYSSILKPSSYFIRLGLGSIKTGTEQHVNRQGLIGDRYLLSHQQKYDGLLNLGALWKVAQYHSSDILLGLDYSYYTTNQVEGDILIENSLKNLHYRYQLHNNALMFSANLKMPLSAPSYASMLEIGLGPNWLSTKNYQENSLDGVTLTADSFKGATNTTLAARIGLSFIKTAANKKNQWALAYVFSYLGRGNLQANSSALLNNLSTGSVINNALTVALYW